MTRAVFLPGAGGRKHFWQPVADLLGSTIEPVVLGWPGFGDEPRDESITGLRDLTGFVLPFMKDGPVDLIAQSMGGVVAMLLTLEHPELVRRLVLTGTSGGIDIAQFGAEDWRAESLAEDVNGPERTPTWFIDDHTDLTARIPSISAPCLLIWGEEDTISPPAVGRYLAALLPDAEFACIPGDHAHPMTNPQAIAPLIGYFLSDSEPALTQTPLGYQQSCLSQTERASMGA